MIDFNFDQLQAAIDRLDTLIGRHRATEDAIRALLEEPVGTLLEDDNTLLEGVAELLRRLRSVDDLNLQSLASVVRSEAQSTSKAYRLELSDLHAALKRIEDNSRHAIVVRTADSGQNAVIDLIECLAANLENRTVIDIGAGDGRLSERLLGVGCKVYAFERSQFDKEGIILGEIGQSISIVAVQFAGDLIGLTTEMRKRGYQWHIVIYQSDDAPVSFYCNLTVSAPQSWGKVLFFRDYSLFTQAYNWCNSTLVPTTFK